MFVVPTIAHLTTSRRLAQLLVLGVVARLILPCVNQEPCVSHLNHRYIEAITLTLFQIGGEQTTVGSDETWHYSVLSATLISCFGMEY